MQQLLEYLYNEEYQSLVLDNLCETISEETINEAFQSSLLLNLAKKIKSVESETAQLDKKRAEHYKEQGYLSTPEKNAKSFSTIFAPVKISSKYGYSKTVQGINWSTIKDSDFVKYTDINDKEFKKVFKSIYNHETNACVICCEPNKDNIIYFIRCYDKKINKDNNFYQFTPTKSWFSRKGVYEKTAPKGKYNERSINMKEALPLIDGLDIYILIVTDDMLKDYQLLTTSRKEAQKGVINYDENSLKQLLKEQQSRYNELVKKMKAMNLRGNIEKYFNEIVETNNEIIDIYKKVTSNPKYMDMQFDLGDLMTYMSYVYEEYYSSMRYTHSADKETKLDPEYRGSYQREMADNKINSSKNYLKRVQDKIQEIKSKM